MILKALIIDLPNFIARHRRADETSGIIESIQNNPTTIRRKGHGMSMGQSRIHVNIDETKETIKREVLDFIAQYGDDAR